MGFGDRLKELRKQKGLTQEQLAEIIGSTKQAISQYERKVRTPDPDVAGVLADYFNVSMDYMFGKSNVTVRLVNAEELELLNGLPINEKEKKIIEVYRTLSKNKKEAFYTFVNTFDE